MIELPKNFAIIIVTLLVAVMLSGCASPEAGTNIYLVRHAEKVVAPNIGKDPNLTEDGNKRAQLLAEMLTDKNITHIHSSDYIRTRDTAKPLADKLGLQVDIYDPRDLEGLAAKIENAGGSHLVVGHSDTIPETVIALSGDGGTPISDDEYDRLYIVRISADAKVQTDLQRFGDPYKSTVK